MNWMIRALAAGLALIGAAAIGCSPEIGDKCSTSTDCSLKGDRLCDTTQPSGYCTIFNCEPDNCPEEAQCVAFDNRLDPICSDPRTWPRFQRAFCMKRCDDNGDCRSGYQCVNMAVQPNPWGATVIDRSPEGTKVCISPAVTGTVEQGRSDLCYPYDGGFPDVGYYVADVGGAEDAGVGDEADATGEVADVADVNADRDVSMEASADVDASDSNEEMSAETDGSLDSAQNDVLTDGEQGP